MVCVDQKSKYNNRFSMGKVSLKPEFVGEVATRADFAQWDN